MTTLQPLEDVLARVDAMNSALPDSARYQAMATIVAEAAEAADLCAMDPFSPGYRQAALGLYLRLRGGSDAGYEPERDERPAGPAPTELWTGLVPWSFRDGALLAEFLYAWGHMLQCLDLRPGARVLEYGPGSGQLLLMLARLGYLAHGVDIEGGALASVRDQAAALGLAVHLEQARFGEGFGDERFDAIVFFEAFHHALDFDRLLLRLHARLAPGGRVVLCGEPVLPAPAPAVPYPWGPRLDALSIYCMRRFGWMELGFSRAFLIEAARRAGWHVDVREFPQCGRAHAYVLRPASDVPAQVALDPAEDPTAPLRAQIAALHGQVAGLHGEVAGLRDEIAATRASSSWRVTAPLRAAARLVRRAP